jgi:hypothetical protein
MIMGFVNRQVLLYSFKIFIIKKRNYNMKKCVFLILVCFSFSTLLSAVQIIKQADPWGRAGTAFGEAFRKGFEDGLRQQRELELLEREKQIQLEILERQRQIQIEILERQRRMR